MFQLRACNTPIAPGRTLATEVPTVEALVDLSAADTDTEGTLLVAVAIAGHTLPYGMLYEVVEKLPTGEV